MQNVAQPYSVVIPAFNAESTIADAVRSILAQSVPPAEIIVVDDGSVDGTAIRVEELAGSIKLIRQANAGPGAATTRGIAEVATPLLAMLDADDVWLTEKAERQLEALRAEGGDAAVFTQYREFRTGRQPTGPAYQGWSRSTIMVRTEVARSVGAIIDPPGGIGDMVDWLARMREAGHSLRLIPEVLVLRRIRPGSLTNRTAEDIKHGYLFVIREAIKRRRRFSGSGQDEK